MNGTIGVLRLPCACVIGMSLIAVVGCDTQPAQSPRISNLPQPPQPPSPVKAAPSSTQRETPKEAPSGMDRSSEYIMQERTGLESKKRESRQMNRDGNVPDSPPDRAVRPGVMRAGHGDPGATSSSSAPTAGTRQSLSVKLSAGVALPQLLPTGTTVGFSVDYVFQRGRPTTGMQTVWIIEMANGRSAEIPVRLRSQGNLSGFVQGTRPEQGPFQSYLAVVSPSGQRLPISLKIAMK